MARTKVVAVLLGPAGIGLLGLLQSLMATATTIAGLGTLNAGTREIAKSSTSAESAALDRARGTLITTTFLLSLLGATTFWALRRPLAQYVLGDQSLSNEVGLLSIGIILGLAGGAQATLLHGLRRISDLAKVTVVASLVFTALGLIALLAFGSDGLVLFVLAGPLSSYLACRYYVSRLRLPKLRYRLRSAISADGAALVRLGVAFMLSALVVVAGELVVKSMLQQQLGTHALGLFQATWTISMTYIGFALGAMGADYFPRVAGSIDDNGKVNRLANEQTEVALLLAGPVLLGMLGLAPWAVRWLYSTEFAPAWELLRFQIMGDILKVASWPLGFIIIAKGDGRTFIFTQTAIILTFVGLTWALLPVLGATAAAIGFAAMYAVALPLNHYIVSRRTGFSWTPRVRRDLSNLILFAACTVLAGIWSQWAGLALGLTATALLAVNALARLSEMAVLPRSITPVAALCRKSLAFLGHFRG